MTDIGPSGAEVPLSHLEPEEKARRAKSFGGAASAYERYRPGPPVAAVEWMVPTHVSRVVDLGAGTGALTRLLIDRADDVVAVEPDDRMRAVLEQEVPGARAVEGRGEAIPVPDGSVNAVVASSSWHWMDPVPTFREVERVLAPGGTLAAVWSGPDPDGALMTQAKEILAARRSGAGGGGGLADLILGDGLRPISTLEVPRQVRFTQPDQEVFSWDMALSADEIVGILGTMSWVITLPDDAREQVIGQARQLLKDVLGVEGDVTIDVGFKAQAWRTRPNRP